MERLEFENAAAQGKVGGVYLFEGSEEYTKQSSIQLLRKTILPEGLEELNESISEESDTDKIIAMAETMPLMSEKRLVVVRNHPSLVGNREADDKLISYISNVPSCCVLIFYCIGKANGTKKLYREIKKYGQIVTFSPMKELELYGWISEQFKVQSKECRRDVAENVVFTVGTDMAQLKSEISKIAASIGDRKKVTIQDVASIATKSSECRVFDLINAVVAGDESLAFTLLKSMLTSGEQRIGILAMLLRQFRIMQQVKIMQSQKATAAEIAAHLSLKTFIADKYIKQTASFTNRQIKDSVNLLVDTEYKIKSGQISENGGLEAALLKLFAMKH